MLKAMKGLVVIGCFFANLTLMAQKKDKSEEFHDELVCFKALENAENGTGFILNENLVTIPGTKGIHRGLYLYTPQMAYFCQLPKTAKTHEDGINEYDLALQIPGSKSIDITFSENKLDASQNEIKVINVDEGSDSEEAEKVQTELVSCGDALTKESRYLIENELSARIDVNSVVDKESKKEKKEARKQEKEEEKEKNISAMLKEKMANIKEKIGDKIEAYKEKKATREEIIEELELDTEQLEACSKVKGRAGILAKSKLKKLRKEEKQDKKEEAKASKQ
jgi:hypothetical protein